MSSANDQAEAPASNDPVTQFFTQREQLMILHGFVAMGNIPSIDYVKVAERMGLKNPRSVANAWGLIRKKVQTFDKEDRKRKGLPSEDEAEPADGADGESGKPTPKRARATNLKTATGTPKTARAKKVAKTPTPKTPRSTKKKTGLLVAAEDLEDDDENVKLENVKGEDIEDKGVKVEEDEEDELAVV